MTINRKPTAFGDMRGWMKALDVAGELHNVDAEVDWNVELGTVTRLAQGPGTGPALLFNAIKDYGKNARCHQVFTAGLASARRVAMMMGLPPDTHRARTGQDRPHAPHREHRAEDRQDRPG